MWDAFLCISLDDVFLLSLWSTLWLALWKVLQKRTSFTHLLRLYGKISCPRQPWPGAQPGGFKSTLPVVEGKREALAVRLLVVITGKRCVLRRSLRCEGKARKACWNRSAFRGATVSSRAECVLTEPAVIKHTHVQTHACKHSNNPSRAYPANIDPYCAHTYSQCKQVPTYVFDFVYLSVFGVGCSHHTLFSLQTDEAGSRCGRSYMVQIRVIQKTHNTK